MTDFGRRLAEERKRLGFNQTDFGKIGGVTKTSQVNYESGERSPNVDYWQAVSQVGADVLYILTGTRSVAAEAAPDRPGVYVADPRKLALLDNYEHSTKEGQRAIERVALLESETQYKDVTAKKKQAG